MHGLFSRSQVLFIFYEVVLGVGWGGEQFFWDAETQKFGSLKGGGGGGEVRQLENLVCKVGLPQIVLELL